MLEILVDGRPEESGQLNVALRYMCRWLARPGTRTWSLSMPGLCCFELPRPIRRGAAKACGGTHGAHATAMCGPAYRQLAKMLDTLVKLELRVRRLVMAPRSSRRPRCARSSSCSLGAPTSRKGGADSRRELDGRVAAGPSTLLADAPVPPLLLLCLVPLLVSTPWRSRRRTQPRRRRCCSRARSKPLCCWACRGGARDPTQAERLWGAGKALPRSAVCRVAVVGDDVRERQALEKVFLRATRRRRSASAALGCGLGTFAQRASSR